MHAAHAALMTRLFTALGAHEHATMASCYHPDARFRDIAFDLHKRRRIHNMWRMICNGDITVDFEVIDADDTGGRVRLVDKYTFGGSNKPPEPGANDPPKKVVNLIESRFLFKDGQIWRHDDYCDAKEWARQALGEGRIGSPAGRSRLLRSLMARAKLAWFVVTHPGSR